MVGSFVLLVAVARADRGCMALPDTSGRLRYTHRAFGRYVVKYGVVSLGLVILGLALRPASSAIALASVLALILAGDSYMARLALRVRHGRRGLPSLRGRGLA